MKKPSHFSITKTGSDPNGLEPASAQTQLKKYAVVCQTIREYFLKQRVLEVHTPLLNTFPVTDPHLDNVRVEKPFSNLDHLYLNTSPEYAMKQLLSLGSGSIYQLCKAFRQDAQGYKHNTEFMLLEWYRESFTLQQLMDDMSNLLQEILGKQKIETVSYREAFIDFLGIDPFELNYEELKVFAKSKIDCDFIEDDKDFWLDLLLSHFIEPYLGKNKITFLIDYPKSQAALAKIKVDSYGNDVAERFEVYIDGLELANGYAELVDAKEQLKRFEADNIKRKQLGKPSRVIDQNLIEALERGVPECAGVALGVDRLMMLV